MAKIGPIFFIILPAVYTEFQPASFLVPFTFKPRIAKKINLKISCDLGQGILDTIHEVYEDLQNDPEIEINTKIFE
mgnify:CR=1 FL=1